MNDRCGKGRRGGGVLNMVHAIENSISLAMTQDHNKSVEENRKSINASIS